jgi:hypothetical protein
VIDRASRFDLLELDGKDMRREPIEHRKSALARLLAKTLPGLQLNEHIAEPGDLMRRVPGHSLRAPCVGARVNPPHLISEYSCTHLSLSQMALTQLTGRSMTI